MPIYVHLDVDIDACRGCAAALDELALSAESGAGRFKDARDKSDSVWQSDAGDAFRGTVSTLVKAAEQVSDRSEDLAEALRSFADSMLTAKEQINRAVAHAMEAGIRVGPDVCNATWISDPLHPTGPPSTDRQTEYERQVSAYNVALDMVGIARTTEADAHAALAAAFDDSEGWLDRLRSSAPWIAAGGAISFLGTAAQQADHWGAVAETRAAQVGRFVDIAGEASPESVRNPATRAAAVFGSSADDAARYAAQNSALLPGRTTKELGGVMSRAMPFAKGIPLAGAGITAVQTVNDLRGAENAGDVAEVVAKDAGGFLAGTAASTVILASFAGGPATVAAVGVGIFVAWGVGEIVEKVAN